jgi:protein-L-isoaspartate(D-aspartate) O-methyltransferase
LLQLEPGMRVLEIGTGSGYQAAVLAEFLEDVYTVEIIRELARWGEENLRRSGYGDVRVKQADGYYGWEEFSPFDAIVVTAAADHIPPPLIEQLAEGGRMVIPVGSPFRTQMLMLVTREGDDIRTENLLPVRFVPFTRDPE